MRIRGGILGLMFLIAATIARAADIQTSGVAIEGTNAALVAPPHPHNAIILLAGGDGYIGVGSDGSIRVQGNQLVRTRDDYAAKGLAVLVPDHGINLDAAVKYMAKYGHVTVMGTSRGTLRAAEGIAAGARPDKLILTSGFLSPESGDEGNSVMQILGSPAVLPPTLIIHHRQDECRFTSPEGVPPFMKWAGGKARLIWLDGGESMANPCQARAHHGFNGLDGEVVARAAAFAR